MEKKFLLNEENIKPLIKIKGSCIASDKITTMGKKIGYMYRENPTSEFDTGWRFFAGDEDEQYTNDSNNFEIYELNTICNYDQDIIPYLLNEIGSKLVKNEDGTYTEDKQVDETADRINNVIDNINEQIKDNPEPKILHCQICNNNLMFMEPDGNTLHCRNCNKFFKNDNGSVGIETTNPYTDPNAIY